jgi:hypothetical protein
MNLMPLAQRLEIKGIGAQGSTIFINMIPAECSEGVLLRNKLQGTLIDYELPGYYKAKFQLIVRAKGYQSGDALIRRTIAALLVNDTQIGTMYVRYMRPATLPVVFPLSKGNLLEFAVDFDVLFNE